MSFGIPYMGSKSKIMPSIALNLPAAENFYDLFGGGFSATHYMMARRAKKYKHFHYNEINGDIVDLVKRAIAGDFNYDKFKPEWICRNKFFERKDSDPYVRCVWSFGNNQRDYLFSEEIEPHKKSLHQAVVFDQFDRFAESTLGFKAWPKHLKSIKEKRLACRAGVCSQLKRTDLQQLEQLERLQQLEKLQQLEQLERLQRLEQLERLQQLSFSALDYRDVPIKENSIVYCDIPYKGTSTYLNSFNHDEFYEWAATIKCPVYVSEYKISDPRFTLIYTIDKRPLLTTEKIVNSKPENLYWNGVPNA